MNISDKVRNGTKDLLQKTVNTLDNYVGKPLQSAQKAVGDSLQKGAKGVVNGWGLAGGGGSSIAYDVKTGVPKPTAVANALRGGGLGMAGELGLRTSYELGKKVYNYVTGSK